MEPIRDSSVSVIPLNSTLSFKLLRPIADQTKVIPSPKDPNVAESNEFVNYYFHELVCILLSSIFLSLLTHDYSHHSHTSFGHP